MKRSISCTAIKKKVPSIHILIMPVMGMFPGILPAKDIRREFSHFMSMKLRKEGDKLCGTIVAVAAAEREYYAYPFFIDLKKQK